MDNKQTQLTGIVVSDKNDKTIIVETVTYKKHKLYSKRVKYTKRYVVHDEKNTAGVGDTVSIRTTTPLSKTKRYELVKVLKKAVVL